MGHHILVTYHGTSRNNLIYASGGHVTWWNILKIIMGHHILVTYHGTSHDNLIYASGGHVKWWNILKNNNDSQKNPINLNNSRSTKNPDYSAESEHRWWCLGCWGECLWVQTCAHICVVLVVYLDLLVLVSCVFMLDSTISTVMHRFSSEHRS